MKKSRPEIKAKPEQPAERLQKVMAGAGLGSRRSLESLIGEGAVQVNGKQARLGESVKPGDLIAFRDREWRVVAETAQQRTLIYNKPEGALTTRTDPQGRPTVFDRLPRVAGARWVAVGRLDINTTGLLLLTTDGELANAMMHPSNQVDREYVCRIRGQVSDEQVEKLRQGVELDDGPARFSDIKRLPGTSGNQWFQVTLLEGRNREVRRLWEAVGCMVSRLKRVRYGAAKLPKGLKVGTWSEITPHERRVLRQDVKLPASSGQLVLKPVKGHGGVRQRRKPQRKPQPSPRRSARPGAKPGSPVGAGRRPHPRSRKAKD
jgi:23S rRNA pseudouridine2605 synthase